MACALAQRICIDTNWKVFEANGSARSEIDIGINVIYLFALFTFCSAHCVPAYHPEPNGVLIFTSESDCWAVAKRLDDFDKQSTYVDEHGKKMSHPQGWHRVCAKSYFADYGQTERLIYGRVTCSYKTTMPESVMARRIDPYQPQHHCVVKK